MNNLIMSISFCYHDSSLCIADSNSIILHLEAERIFRKKHFRITNHKDVEFFISEALKNIGASIDNVDKLLITTFKNIYENEQTISILGKNFIPELTSHHHNHIGTAIPSGYEKAVIVCADGGSEDGTTKIYYKNGNEYTCVDDLDDTHMTGKFYGNITQMVIHPNLRFAHNFYAGKLMGLSALGSYQPRYKELFKNHHDEFIKYHTPNCEDLLNLFELSNNYHNPWEDEHRTNLAFTGHNYWVDTFAEYLKKHNSYSRNIALVGGCALNIDLNSKLIDDGIYDNVYVSPISTDAGQSLGAILYKYPHIKCNYPFLGRSFGTINTNFDDTKVLDMLLNEKIIAWYQDRSEIGARALGHRSFIGIPTSVEMKEKLSVKIKKREMYRPVAAMIPKELVSEYFYQDYDSPYMTFCAKAKPITIEKAPAIVHYDGTTRVQTLTKDDNPILYSIMMKLFDKTGVPILMNTSFNVAGEPIVDTPEDAINSFKKSGADALFINGIPVFLEPWEDHKAKITTITSQLDKEKMALAEEKAKYQTIRQSLSWRITRPLRILGRMLGI